MNKLILIGHLGRDPVMRYTPEGQAVTSFRAISWGKGDRQQTQWFNVSAWDRQAELCNEYLHKGSQVYVEGRIKGREYEDRNGDKRFSLDVTLETKQRARFVTWTPSRK